MRAERARRAKSSLELWSRFVDREYLTPEHIKKLDHVLTRMEAGDPAFRRVMVFMPPRCGKSEKTSRKYPAWFMGRNPDKRVMLASHTASLAESFSRNARDYLMEYGAEVFGHTVSRASSSVSHWTIDGHRGELFACGVGGPATGQGADLLIIDDPVKDAQEAFSASQREAVWTWYQMVVRPRVHPNGAILLVMTRWHADDLAGRLLKAAEKGGEKWHVISMPMVDCSGDYDVTKADPESKADMAELAKRLLWKGRYSPAETAQLLKAVGEYAREALYMQRPANPSGNIFKRTWWRYCICPQLGNATDFDGPLDRRIHLSDLEWIAQSLDCTFKDTDGTDYVVNTVWGGIGTDRFLLDVVKDRLSFVETVRMMQMMSKKWDELVPRLAGHAKYIEDKANGTAVINALQSKVPSLIAIQPQGSKEARARACSPQVEGGNVFLLKGALWVPGFISEHADFPTGEHDDQVDSTSQLLNRMSNPEACPEQSTLALATW